MSLREVENFVLGYFLIREVRAVHNILSVSVVAGSQLVPRDAPVRSKRVWAVPDRAPALLNVPIAPYPFVRGDTSTHTKRHGRRHTRHLAGWLFRAKLDSEADTAAADCRGEASETPIYKLERLILKWPLQFSLFHEQTYCVY